MIDIRQRQWEELRAALGWSGSEEELETGLEDLTAEDAKEGDFIMRKNTYRLTRKRIAITKHFEEKWRERYGYCPGEREIEGILVHAALAQRSKRVALANGGVSHEPSIYVDFDRCICLLVDETPHNSVRLITFLDPADMNGKQERRLFVPLREALEVRG